MSDDAIPVTLAYVLDKRMDQGLTNDEIVAILNEGVQSLRPLIQNARLSSVYNMGLSMESVYLFPDGSLSLKPLPFEILNSRFLPPEYNDKCNDSAKVAQELEKMYIFCFGAVLVFALEYGSQGIVMSTPEVYSLLNLMTIRDPAVRFDMPKVIQMVAKLVQMYHVESTAVIRTLYCSVSNREIDAIDEQSGRISNVKTESKQLQELSEIKLTAPVWDSIDQITHASAVSPLSLNNANMVIAPHVDSNIVITKLDTNSVESPLTPENIVTLTDFNSMTQLTNDVHSLIPITINETLNEPVKNVFKTDNDSVKVTGRAIDDSSTSKIDIAGNHDPGEIKIDASIMRLNSSYRLIDQVAISEKDEQEVYRLDSTIEEQAGRRFGAESYSNRFEIDQQVPYFADKFAHSILQIAMKTNFDSESADAKTSSDMKSDDTAVASNTPENIFEYKMLSDSESSDHGDDILASIVNRPNTFITDSDKSTDEEVRLNIFNYIKPDYSELLNLKPIHVGVLKEEKSLDQENFLHNSNDTTLICHYSESSIDENDGANIYRLKTDIDSNNVERTEKSLTTSNDQDNDSLRNLITLKSASCLAELDASSQAQPVILPKKLAADDEKSEKRVVHLDYSLADSDTDGDDNYSGRRSAESNAGSVELVISAIDKSIINRESRGNIDFFDGSPNEQQQHVFPRNDSTNLSTIFASQQTTLSTEAINQRNQSSPVIFVHDLIKLDDVFLDENTKFGTIPCENLIESIERRDSSSFVPSTSGQRSYENQNPTYDEASSNLESVQWTTDYAVAANNTVSLDFFAASNGFIQSAPSSNQRVPKLWEEFDAGNDLCITKNKSNQTAAARPVASLSPLPNDRFNAIFDDPIPTQIESFDSWPSGRSIVPSKSDEILAKLMPLTPEDFAQPKYHAPFVATRRKHHSWRCEFCSPRKRRAKLLADCQVRHSLPNKYRSNNDLGAKNASYAFYQESRSKNALTFLLPKSVAASRDGSKIKPRATSIDGEPDSIEHSLLRQRDDEDEDNLFGSFENLPVIPRSPSPFVQHCLPNGANDDGLTAEDSDVWSETSDTATKTQSLSKKISKPDSYTILSAKSPIHNDASNDASRFGSEKQSSNPFDDSDEENGLKTIRECDDGDSLDDDSVNMGSHAISGTMAEFNEAQGKLDSIQRLKITESDISQKLKIAAVSEISSRPIDTSNKIEIGMASKPPTVVDAAPKAPSRRRDKARALSSKSDSPAPLISESNEPAADADPDGPGFLSRGNSMRIKPVGGSVRGARRRSVEQSVLSTSNNGDLSKGRAVNDNTNHDFLLVKNEKMNKGKGQLAFDRQSDLYYMQKSWSRTSGSTRKIGHGPEFLFNSRQPSVRLKAPAAQRQKKLFRHFMEKNVLVILLNGQRVDVACRTDSTAENIFESVSVHTNLNERHFFGLTVLRDGEHFFLEPEQKLEKFAPPGWRSHSRHVINARILFTLFLRMKYYPITLDFVKTEQTLHHIYLQLRRDILDERLQCDRKKACELAGLALQAEYGDFRPDTAEYFALSHYMPDRHFLDEIGEQDEVKRTILESWSKNARVESREAEIEYVKLCQSLREYGIHFHRLYRTKPSQMLAPSPLGDPDTGTPLWIGIMPRGIIIFEERGGERVPVSQHPWHLTATLQFDHKRFVICPLTDNAADDAKFIYYTDDYKKSMYFVNFAASQHRFCMKMRSWAATLPADRLSASRSDQTSLPRTFPSGGKRDLACGQGSATETDSGISREASPDDAEIVGGAFAGSAASAFSKPLHHQERAVDAGASSPFAGRLISTPKKLSTVAASQGSTTAGVADSVANVSILSTANRPPSLVLNPNETITASLNERLENATTSSPISASSGPDFETFSVTLVKDPHFGLGLTLVDGEIEKIAGVYVRSITPGGPASCEGNLRVADRVISVNGVSLEGKNRHDAVDLVRRNTDHVQMGIVRLRYAYSSNESIENKERANAAAGTSARTDGTTSAQPASSSARVTQPDILLSSPAVGVHDSPSPFDDSAAQNSMLWLNDTSTSGGVSFYARTLSSLDGAAAASRMYAGLNDDDDDDDENKNADGDQSESSCASGDDQSEADKMVYDRRLANGAKTASKLDGSLSAIEIRASGLSREGGVHKKYSRNAKSSLVEQRDDDVKRARKGHHVRKAQALTACDLNPSANSRSRSLSNLTGKSSSGDAMNAKDWTENLRIDSSEWKGDDFDLVNVSLHKNEVGGLGIQVAGGKGQKKVYIKSLVAEPALSCKSIQAGDQLASVNEVSTRGLSHHGVVALLKNAKSPVHLGLLRVKKSVVRKTSNNTQHTIPSVETLDIMLEKPASGSLGLSLARPPNSEGIYIRVITPGSVAASDGRLKAGDRLWTINGDSVAQSSPTEVVEKLKAAQGFVKLIVKREAKDSNGDLVSVS